MHRKKTKPPPGCGGTYIKPNTQIAAILSNGIAAIFYSTNIILIAFAFTNTSNILLARVSVFRWARAFLFQLKVDKPSHNYGPGCRSPPISNQFLRFPKKLIGDKKMVRSIYRPDYSKLYPDTPISDKVMAELRASDYKIEYQEYDLKRERWKIDQTTQTVKRIPSREDSYDRLLEEDRQFAQDGESVEDMAVKNIMLEKLPFCLDLLNENDRWIIDELFYGNKTEIEVAEILGVHQSTVSRRLSRILAKLRRYMEK